MADNRRTIIVGGGIAGLGAAYTLQKRGLATTVLEAGTSPGGRVLTDRVDGFHIDAGANVFLETYGTVRQIASELGVSMKRTPVPINGGVYHDGDFHGFYGGTQPLNRLKTAIMFGRFQLLSPRGLWEALKLVRFMHTRRHSLSLDDTSGLMDLDVPENTGQFFRWRIGTEFFERFFQSVLTSYTFGAPEEIGIAQALVSSWHLGLNGGMWPIMPAQGPGEFMDALSDYCQYNIEPNTPVQRIIIEDEAVKGVILDSGDFVEADTVICATTATTSLKITPNLPTEISDVLSRVRYSKCCRVVFGTDTNPFPKDWYALSFPRQSGALMSGMSNSAVLAPEAVPAGKSCIDVFVMGENAEKLFALSDSDVERLVKAEIRRYLPAMPDHTLFTRVYRWPEAVCLLSGGLMTDLYRMRNYRLHQIKGLFLAGEHLGVPSTNGALRSGIDAAQACAEFLSASGRV